MDNNFNQQAPQQPMYQQAPQQQMPQQQMYQQPMYQQPVYQPVPKAPKNMKELLAFILAASAALLAILGATFTCSCSASKTSDARFLKYSLSAIFILSIFAAIIAAAGAVCAIIALKQKDAVVKAGKMSYIAIAACVFAIIYTLIPTITVCGYNCSMNNARTEFATDQVSGYADDYSDYYDYLN